MKYFILFLFSILILTYGYCETPYKFVDKKLSFAKASSGSELFWTEEECNNYEVLFPTASILTYDPLQYEIAISTILNPTTRVEFELYKTKKGFFNKILEFQNSLTLAETLQDSEQIAYYTNLLNYLKSIYALLQN